MSFYADVPAHTWKLFGSYAIGREDSKSDFDVVLCGVNKKQLEHPFFEDIIGQLRPYSVEEGKHLDLFIDHPDKHKFVSVFSPERAINAGADVYRAIQFSAKKIDHMHLMRACAYLSASAREPICSEEEFVERQQAKHQEMERLLLASKEAEASLPGTSRKARAVGGRSADALKRQTATF